MRSLWVGGLCALAWMTALVLAPTLGRAAAPAAGAETTFTDMGQASWAVPSVAELAFQGIVQGVGNGRFDPSGVVTRAEVLAILQRAFYPTSAPPAVALAFSDSRSIPPWALGAVQEDVAQGLLANAGPLRPNAPATRAQVAAWLVAAMGLGGLATGADESNLSRFQDQSQIPAAERGSVALALALGLMNGESATKLDPQGSITRAELAVLLARVEDRYGLPVQLASPDPDVLRGIVAAAGNGSLTLTQDDGSTITVPMAPDARILGGAIQPGAAVAVGIAGGEARLVLVETTSEANVGVVAAVDPTLISVVAPGAVSPDATQADLLRSARTYAVQAGAPVFFAGQRVSPSHLSYGSLVRLELDPTGTAVSAIVIERWAAETAGRVVGFAGSQPVVSLPTGTDLAVLTGSDTNVLDGNDNLLAPGDIHVGDMLLVTGSAGPGGIQADSVVVNGGVDEVLFGRLTSVDDTSLTLDTGGAAPVTLPLSPSLTIVDEGGTATVANDLFAGEDAMVEVGTENGAPAAERVVIEDDLSPVFSGTVTAVGSDSFTMADAAGNRLTFAVDNVTTVTDANDDVLPLSALTPGQAVTVTAVLTSAGTDLGYDAVIVNVGGGS
jgi:hypothetical protein